MTYKNLNEFLPADILPSIDGVISDVRVWVSVTPVDFNKARETHIKRTAIRRQADDLMEGLPVKILRDGNPYTLDDMYIDVANHPLYSGALKAAYLYDVKPMRDLIRRITQRVVSEHLCPGEADELGFSK